MNAATAGAGKGSSLPDTRRLAWTPNIVRRKTKLVMAGERPGKHTTEELGRRLLEIVVYGKRCRIGGTLTLDDLAETEIGDWKMPAFKAACAYAASQGWLIVQDNALTLTAVGLAAA